MRIPEIPSLSLQHLRHSGLPALAPPSLGVTLPGLSRRSLEKDKPSLNLDSHQQRQTSDTHINGRHSRRQSYVCLEARQQQLAPCPSRFTSLLLTIKKGIVQSIAKHVVNIMIVVFLCVPTNDGSKPEIRIFQSLASACLKAKDRCQVMLLACTS